MFRNSHEGFTVCDPRNLKELSIIVLVKLSISVSATPNIYKHIPNLPRSFGYSAASAKIVLSNPSSFGEYLGADFMQAIKNITTLSATITFPTFARQWMFYHFFDYDSLLRNQLELNIPFFKIQESQNPRYYLI